MLSFVARTRGIDFRDYRHEPLWRRTEARLRASGCATIADYSSRLRSDPAELDRFVDALLVPVTEFFRDPRVFEQVSERVLADLTKRRSFLQAWVAGAATGEEAYTLAMLLADVAANHRGVAFEVIASDIHRPSLEVARAGVYPVQSVAAVPERLRRRYLRFERDTVRIADSIRHRVRFAEHDLVGPQLAPREAVIATFDLVLCRNVLLYFDDSLRTAAVERLAAVIQADGALVLGTVETLPAKLSSFFERYPGTEQGSGIWRRASW